MDMTEKRSKPHRKIGPLFETERYWEVKDPCIVFDGLLWQIYGSGISKDGSGLRIVHALSPSIEGPWTEGEAKLDKVSTEHAAAPGVIYDTKDSLFHMAIQEDFTSIGGEIQYFVSKDGKEFSHIGNLLEPIHLSHESGLYDPHFSLLQGERYLSYAGMPGIMDRTKPFVPQPDIYLAKSETKSWKGPWKRLGKILDHDHISWHHNKRGHPDYEWGIEGPQLISLPDGRFLLNATCFLENRDRGERQRVFFALANKPEGPYETLGPVLEPEPGAWDSGENGHATAYVEGDTLYLFYQGRSYNREAKKNGRWKYGIALFRIGDL